MTPPASSLPSSSQTAGSGQVLVDGVDVEREVDPVRRLVVEGDIEVLGVHELGDDRVDGGIELGHVADRRRRLGDLEQRRFDPVPLLALALEALELGQPGPQRGDLVGGRGPHRLGAGRRSGRLAGALGGCRSR